MHSATMAAVSGGSTSVTRDEEHDIELFLEAMRRCLDYPFNLHPRHTENVKLVRDFRRHFDQTKDDILLVLRKNAQGVRRRLIEKKIHIQFYDAGLLDVAGMDDSKGRPPPDARSQNTPILTLGDSSWDYAEDTSSYYISNCESLDAKFGLGPPCSRRQRDSNAPANDQPKFQPFPDPVCRFLYVTRRHRSSSLSINTLTVLGQIHHHLRAQLAEAQDHRGTAASRPHLPPSATVLP